MSSNSKAASVLQISQVSEGQQVSQDMRFAGYTLLDELPWLIFGLMRWWVMIRRLSRQLLKAGASALKLSTTIFCLIASTGSVQASMLSLSGPSPDQQGAVAAEGTDVLYSTDRAGHEVELAETGVWQGLDLRDLGLPFVTINGNVLFGGAVAHDGELRWQIFQANPDRRSLRTLELPEKLVMRTDPRPMSEANGTIVFSATDPIEAVYRLMDSKVTCLLRVGQRLSDDRLVRSIAIGSVSVAQNGAIALMAFLEPGGESEILVAGNHVTAVASHDDEAPNGVRFLHFGRPAISEEDGQSIIVFKAQTDRRDRLYAYQGGRTHLILSRGDPCPGGKITFLSDDAADFVSGGIVINATCAGRLQRLLIVKGRVIGSYSPYRLLSARAISDTSLTSPHWVEGTSISVNQNGQAAYLGSH